MAMDRNDAPAYPVGLRLSGRRVVVLGGGQVAQRRLPRWWRRGRTSW